MKVGDLVKHREEDCLSSGVVEPTKGYGTGVIIADKGWDYADGVKNEGEMFIVWWPKYGKAWERSYSLEVVSES